jgi:uncharacterized protein (TIGR02145 family)
LTFGNLYNAHAVLDERGLCPSGWHPSTDEDWQVLEGFLGMSPNQILGTGWRGNLGGSLRGGEWCEMGWDNSTDIYGFNARPGGKVVWDCHYDRVWEQGWWWSISESGGLIARGLEYANLGINRQLYSSSEYLIFAKSVRCVRNN